ncbi:erg26, C-3 sterol dehydrogenase [Diaporthe australafricana]|uniref:Erg26, C-3 sterol dehydrogenase n=1 Tax=Diaporthe australafricana TaxID=127596 RepID=A0ABR3W014_9PEZI
MTDHATSSDLGPVIITGGCGFVGSHLAEGLLAENPSCQIHVIDINTERNRVPGVHYHTCDITSSADVESVFVEIKPQTVFHVASPDPLFLNPTRFRSVNVDGTKHLLDAAKKTKSVKAFVYTSSSSAIHDNVSELIDADESLPVLRYPAQKRVYTLTKVEVEDDILATNRQDGDSSMLTVSIRPATAFGARDFGFLGKVIAQARAGKANVQIGPGKNYYDVTYISNLVDAHLLAAHALINAYGKAAPPLERRVDGQAFIITNDEPVLFWDFQRAIAASIGMPVKQEDIKVVPYRVAMLAATVSEWSTWIFSFGKKQAPITREAVHLSTITRTLKCDKAKRILGYKPKVGVYEGLEESSKWFVEEAKGTELAKKTV